MEKYRKLIQDIRIQEHQEDVFQEPHNRHVIFPLKDLESWRHYKKHMSTFWTADEVNLSNDIPDWNRLDTDVREYILKILAFFAASDGIVCENLLERFLNEVKVPEMKYYYTFQGAMENIHSEMYSQLIDAFEIDPRKKDRLFNAVEHSKPIGDKARWALRWIGGGEEDGREDTTIAHRLLVPIIRPDETVDLTPEYTDAVVDRMVEELMVYDGEDRGRYMDRLDELKDIEVYGKVCERLGSRESPGTPEIRDMPFALRLLAFIIVEGVFFSSSFAGIFWVRTMNLGLPGLVESNDFISRDEGLHTDFGVHVFRTLKHRPSEDLVHDMFREAVDCEIAFTEYILPTRLKGMNVELMSDYVRYVADRLCTQLGYEKIYGSENPFGWMEKISVQGKANFFERPVTEYNMGSSTTGFGELEDF